jgi:hypothetical protein
MFEANSYTVLIIDTSFAKLQFWRNFLSYLFLKLDVFLRLFREINYEFISSSMSLKHKVSKNFMFTKILTINKILNASYELLISLIAN